MSRVVGWLLAAVASLIAWVTRNGDDERVAAEARADASADLVGEGKDSLEKPS